MVTISEIMERAEAVGLSLRQLAEEAGVAPSTCYRARRGADPRTSTIRKLMRALEAREAAMRQLARYLADLVTEEEAHE